MMSKKEPRKAALTFIFITVVLDTIGLGIILPVIPALIMELTGEGLGKAAVYGGWLMFVYAAMQFLCAPIMGGLSDRFGRRPVLLLSLAGFGIDYIITGFAPTIYWLFGARILAGVFGASHTTATAYIADISEPEKRAQNFGLIGAAFGMGFILGPVIGGLLGEYGARVPFFASAALAFLNCAYGYFILPESLSEENRRPFEWKRANPLGSLLQVKKFPAISGLVVIYFILYLSHHATQSTWTYFTMFRFEWNEAMVGFSLGIVGVCVAIVQGGLTRVVIPRWGEQKSVYIGLIFYMIGFLGFAFAPSGWVILVMIAPFALGGFAGPALQGIISNGVENNQQGELQGALTSLISLTAIIGPPMMTGLFGYFTSEQAPFVLPGAAFVAGSILCAVSLAGSYLVMRKWKVQASN
jgi:DHA1 family tetracycline resistance protein-like MFS transporter